MLESPKGCVEGGFWCLVTVLFLVLACVDNSMPSLLCRANFNVL